MNYKTHRILIWGKTYPELSTKHDEVVCTGGVFENGQPVRIYPLPFRYLTGEQQFAKYQWITADVTRNQSDPRPESYKVMPTSIQVNERIDSKHNWQYRKKHLFQDTSWHYESMEALNAANDRRERSIAMFRPTEIIDVTTVQRERVEKVEFLKKKSTIEVRHEQEDLFGESGLIKDIDFIPERVAIKWRCADIKCGSSTGHKLHYMQVLDWEICELARRKGVITAQQAVADVCDPDEYDIRFFLSTLALHANRFIIAGLWRPPLQPSNSQLSFGFD